MNFIIPKNIFSALLTLSLPDDEKKNIIVKESSLISREIAANPGSVGLIPSCDLINHRDLFVSSKSAVSFDGMLSNAYLYFPPDEKGFKSIYMRGDVSINEIILSKIMFSERFSSQVEIVVDSGQKDTASRNYLVAGNENFTDWDYRNSISFADNIAELIDGPYVNYVLASADEENLKIFAKNLDGLDSVIDDSIAKYLSKTGLGDEVNQFITENLGSVYFEMTENEKNSLTELLKLVYYHGIVEDLFDIKFV